MMFKKKRIIGFFLIVLVLVLVGTTGVFIYDAKAKQEDDFTALKKLYMILDLVERNYVDKPELDKLLTGAIDGMLESLDDPYTSYLTAQEFKDMQSEFEGKYGGIGIVITMKEEHLIVAAPMEGTPGDRAGLESGDMIVAVDGVSTEGLPIEKSVKMMKGEPQTKVVLSIKRKMEDKNNDDVKERFKEFNVNVIREEIELSYVDSEMKGDKIGYIRLSQFISGVGEEVESQIDKLHKEGAQAFIIDLRNNPGGLFSEARKVTSNFIDAGTIVSVKDRAGNEEKASVFKGIKAIDEPIVILVNELTASSSEIVTGAIQDYNRGRVIGKQTFGKGVVQNIVPLSDGSAVKLTTARYYTPQGRYIHKKGIKPDIIVEYDPESKEDTQLQKAIEVLKDELN